MAAGNFNTLRGFRDLLREDCVHLTALEEAENAIGQVLTASSAVDLNPQNAYIRRLQHLQAQRYNLLSRSLGKEPDRYVRIGPTRGG